MDDNQASDAAKNLKVGITNAVENASDLAGRAQTAAVQAGSTIRDAAIETSKQVSDAAAKTYAQGSQAAEYVSRQTAEQPLLALLVAGAIGYVIAYMIHSR
jgi:ElaB/YqjD/DUF883 family membrane-anchored ribosome-binding protein